MSNKKLNTVFIIGAGASLPYGFPTSRMLRKDIIDNLYDRFFQIYNEQGFSEKFVNSHKADDINNFRERFNLSSINSVDYFIARNPKYLDLGKEAIILHLLEYEKSSSFREDSHMKDCDWYSYLFNYMIQDLKNPSSFNKISDNYFSFLTFNYERSFEYFLYHSLVNSFEELKTTEQLKQTIIPIPIVHIYGSIAPLPLSKNSEGISYGSNIDLDTLEKLKGNIKTVSEKHSYNEEVIELVQEADRIFFLGFGYDKTNLSNIGIPHHLREDQVIYGTVKGHNKRFIKELKEYFIKQNYNYRKKRDKNNPKVISDRNIIFEDVNVLTLLENYL